LSITRRRRVTLRRLVSPSLGGGVPCGCPYRRRRPRPGQGAGPGPAAIPRGGRL